MPDSHQNARLAFIEQLPELLALHPEQSEAAGFVAASITDAHMAAALWMQRQYGMRVDAVNLGNMIDFWAQAVRTSELSRQGKPTLLLARGHLLPGLFNPCHLIAYFASVALAA